MLGITSDRPGGAFFSDGTVAGGQNGVVLVRDIDFASTDEATLLPFHGRCHVAYIPSGGVVLGLSKMARWERTFLFTFCFIPAATCCSSFSLPSCDAQLLSPRSSSSGSSISGDSWW